MKCNFEAIKLLEITRITNLNKKVKNYKLKKNVKNLKVYIKMEKNL